MSTKKPTQIKPYGEDYNGHHIGSALKGVEHKDPVSGHQWTEQTVLRTFSVHVLENSPTPTRPAQGWSRRLFHSLKLARREVDELIALDFAVARIAHKNGAVLDGTRYEQTWRDRVLAKSRRRGQKRYPCRARGKKHTQAGPGAA